jgi:hypothetical protein
MATDPKDYQIEILRGECERLKKERDEAREDKRLHVGELERTIDRLRDFSEVKGFVIQGLEEKLLILLDEKQGLGVRVEKLETIARAAKEFLTNLEPFAYRFPNSAWNSGYDALVTALNDTEDEELAARQAEYDGDDGEAQDAG